MDIPGYFNNGKTKLEPLSGKEKYMKNSFSITSKDEIKNLSASLVVRHNNLPKLNASMP